MRGLWLSLIVVVPLFVGLFALGEPLIGVVILLLWILAAAYVAMKAAVKPVSQDLRDDMDPESRSLFIPIRRLTDEIEEVVAKHSDSAIMKVVGAEAVQEAQRIRDQVGKALAARSELKRTIREKNMATLEANELRAKAESAETTEAKVTILSALEAKQMELDHYKTVDDVIVKIDAGTSQAKSALSEMKARLAVKAASEKTSAATEDADLRDTIGRLKALSVSYDEAEQLLQG